MVLGSELRIKSGQKNQGPSWFSPECDFLCTLADSTLTDMVQRIFNGFISLQEMETVFHKKSQVEKLCAANSQYNWDDVKSCLDLRINECRAFQRHKEILGAFCRELQAYNLPIEGQLCVCQADKVVPCKHQLMKK